MASSESIAAVQDSRVTKQSATDALSPVVGSTRSKVSSGLSEVFFSNNTTDNDCCLRVGFGKIFLHQRLHFHFLLYFMPLFANYKVARNKH
jgi:hypothetical protein